MVTLDNLVYLFFRVAHTIVLAPWDIRSTIRQEIVEEKGIAISSLGRWQRKRTDTAIFDAPFSNGYPKQNASARQGRE